MNLVPRSRWVVLYTMAAVPAVLLVTACSSSTSATAPTAPTVSPSVDTVAVDLNSMEITRYTNVSDSGYGTQASSGVGDFVQIYSASPNTNDAREVMQYALPALRGAHVVDSATVYEYACSGHASNGEVTRGPAATAAPATRIAAQRARAADRIGARDALAPAIMLDHIHLAGAVADSTAWGADQMGASVTLIAASDGALGWKSVSVTSSVQADYAAGNANSQYRIRYASNPGGSFDTYFGGVDCTASNDTVAGSSYGGSYMVVWSH
jgi:hypothetical protein